MSSSFDALHPQVQKWVYAQGWPDLRDAQKRAIEPILSADRSVIISAATAAGKTEAAFLPIFSRLLSDLENDPEDGKQHHGIQVLCLSPLKALINDQHRRLSDLGAATNISVHRWHGDISSSLKAKILKSPTGVLLITPESLEAMFVTRGTETKRIFDGLRYVVLDEMHDFISTERGAQTQSLINRVELVVRKRVARIGLSATLANMSQGADFICPSDAPNVVLIKSEQGGTDLLMQMRGYLRTQDEDGEDSGEHHIAIAEHIYNKLRGKDNLVFANTRTAVETYADILSSMSATRRVPNEFWAHHGSLSKEIRAEAEAQLKNTTRPATAVCTSTLEMGIDIGSVECIAQIEPPPSVASLRQRLGRSGRRGTSSILRLYVSEPELTDDSDIQDTLRCNIAQTTAMVELMLAGWLEKPDDPGFNYSTLIQQILSTIAQHSGATAQDLYSALCGPGPFHLVTPDRFMRLLRAMAENDLLSQTADGTLLSGLVGGREINNYEFYAAFGTIKEWRLTTAERYLGTIPTEVPMRVGMRMVFAGKRWKVNNVDTTTETVVLEKASGGKPPMFSSGKPTVSNQVRMTMREVYLSSERYSWMDAQAQAFLTEGREAFQLMDLERNNILPTDTGCIMLPWCGDKALHTLALMFKQIEINANVSGLALEIAGEDTCTTLESISEITGQPEPTPTDLAQFLENREVDKWDWALDETLAVESVGAKLLDVDMAWSVLIHILAQRS